MSLQTQQAESTSASKIKELGDFHPLVVARVVVEWARIDRLFPMQMWGHEYLGTHVTVGLDRYFIAYNAQQPQIYFYVTREIEALGKRLGQETWRTTPEELHERGCHARMERV